MAYALSSEEYPFTVNYTNNAPQTIKVARENNVVTINYTRIKVNLVFDGTTATSGEITSFEGLTDEIKNDIRKIS